MNLIINPELVQELLQYAGEMAVVSPMSLRETLKKRFREALEINEL
jgi:predicted DNA-binding transcriptional regulator YafY